MHRPEEVDTTHPDLDFQRTVTSARIGRRNAVASIAQIPMRINRKFPERNMVDQPEMTFFRDVAARVGRVLFGLLSGDSDADRLWHDLENGWKPAKEFAVDLDRGCRVANSRNLDLFG